jgi:hypothetical protein
VGAFEALLVMERTAVAVPEVCGANVRVNGTLCPAAIVSGKEIPVSENSTSLTLADETITLAPLALRLLARLALAPTVTLPKSNATGVRAT